MGKIPVKLFSGRVWGNIGTPKRFLGTIQTIPLAKDPGKPHGGSIPPQSYVFRAPFLGPKRAPGPSGTQTLTWGSKNGVRGQKYQSCVSKNHAEPNGRCPKRGHMLQVKAKFVFGVGPQILDQPLALGQPLRPRGNRFAPGATPWPKGQPLCPWGNPFALGQPLCPGATPLP